MNNKISLDGFPGSTKLFIDFINNSNVENIDFRPIITKVLSNKSFNRKEIINVISNTMDGMSFSEKQKINLQLLENDNSFAVVTGQQAGFLGGSLYTLLKAVDTVRISNNLKSVHPENNFVPIFWIEDNDDDLAEASGTYLYDSSYNAINYKLHYDENICVSETKISDKDLEIINLAKKELSTSQFCSKICEMIDGAYKQGDSWSESFTKLYQSILGETGILFLSASKLMKSGLFRDLILQEIEFAGRSKESVEKRNAELDELGYHQQATASDVNLFFHSGQKRSRIDVNKTGYTINNEHISKESLLNFAGENPSNFCPKVLLRPIFQDYILPTIIYVAGPGEIAYHAQTDYLYKDFGVQKPVLVMRTTATIIDKKISRYLSKISQSPDYFFKSYQEIEQELANQLLGEHHEEIFAEFRAKFNELFTPLESYLLSIDNQLDRSINGAVSKINDQFDQLDKKAHSSAKRNNEELIQKYKASSNAIFPHEKPQERSISPLVFLAQHDNLIDILLGITEISANEHIFLEI